MTPLIAPKTSSFFPSFFTSLIDVCVWPIQALRAQEQLNKFRSADAMMLRDLGLSSADLDRATLGTFMPQSRR